MTSTETTEPEELSGRVLGIIAAYRIGAVRDARELYLTTGPRTTPEPVLVPGEGYIEDGVYHVADPARSRRDGGEAPRRSPARRTLAV